MTYFLANWVLLDLRSEQRLQPLSFSVGGGVPQIQKNWSLGEGPVWWVIFSNFCSPKRHVWPTCVPNIIYIYIYIGNILEVGQWIPVSRVPYAPWNFLLPFCVSMPGLCQCLSSPNRVRLATQPCQGHRPLLQKVHDFRLSHGWNEIDSQDGLSLKAQVHRRANRQHMTLKSVEIMHIPLSHRHPFCHVLSAVLCDQPLEELQWDALRYLGFWQVMKFYQSTRWKIHEKEFTFASELKGNGMWVQ